MGGAPKLLQNDLRLLAGECTFKDAVKRHNDSPIFITIYFRSKKMNILLLDGGKEFGHSHGELNHTLHKKAKEVLTALGHNVQEP